MKIAISCKHSLNNVVLIMYKPCLTTIFFHQVLLTFCWSENDMWTLPNGTFEWLEIYETITYFFFWTRIALRKGRKKYLLKYFNLYITLQSSFSWKNFALMKMDSYKVSHMIALLVGTIVSKFLLILNPEYTSV